MEVVEQILGVFFNPIVQGIITALAGLAIAQWKRYKDFYKEIVDVGKAYLKGRDPKSPGGRKLTQEEYAAIGKEVIEAIEAGAPLFKKK